MLAESHEQLALAPSFHLWRQTSPESLARAWQHCVRYDDLSQARSAAVTRQRQCRLALQILGGPLELVHALELHKRPNIVRATLLPLALRQNAGSVKIEVRLGDDVETVDVCEEHRLSMSTAQTRANAPFRTKIRNQSSCSTIFLCASGRDAACHMRMLLETPWRRDSNSGSRSALSVRHVARAIGLSGELTPEGAQLVDGRCALILKMAQALEELDLRIDALEVCARWSAERPCCCVEDAQGRRECWSARARRSACGAC